MNNFLSIILAAAQTTSTAHLDFLRDYKKKSKSLHIFLEGRDDPSFYANFISQVNVKNYENFYYNCKNKDGVYTNHSNIDWTAYNKNRTLFFVDKDYSNYLSRYYTIDENIFVTKYYSIENYIVNKSVLERVLRELASIEKREFIDAALDLFDRNYFKFCQYFMPITSWIIIQKGMYPNFVLKQVDLKYIFHFSNMELSKNITCNGDSLNGYLTKSCNGGSIQNNLSDFVSTLKMIKSNDCKDALRGKFEMWFFVKFIDEYIRYLNNNLPAMHKKFKLAVSLSVNNAVQHMGPRTSIPFDLHHFLTSHYLKL